MENNLDIISFLKENTMVTIDALREEDGTYIRVGYDQKAGWYVEIDMEGEETDCFCFRTFGDCFGYMRAMLEKEK